MMSSNKTNDTFDVSARDDGKHTLTRRIFLRRGAVAGLGAAALYVAPSMSSTRARRAYAGITGGCDDAEPPEITFVSTSPDAVTHNAKAGAPFFVRATDNHSLERIEIEIVALSLKSIHPISCGGFVIDELHNFDLWASLPTGFHDLLVTVFDCCGNVATHDFKLNAFELEPSDT